MLPINLLHYTRFNPFFADQGISHFSSFKIKMRSKMQTFTWINMLAPYSMKSNTLLLETSCLKGKTKHLKQ